MFASNYAFSLTENAGREQHYERKSYASSIPHANSSPALTNNSSAYYLAFTNTHRYQFLSILASQLLSLIHMSKGGLKTDPKVKSESVSPVLFGQVKVIQDV